MQSQNVCHIRIIPRWKVKNEMEAATTLSGLRLSSNALLSAASQPVSPSLRASSRFQHPLDGADGVASRVFLCPCNQERGRESGGRWRRLDDFAVRLTSLLTPAARNTQGKAVLGCYSLGPMETHFPWLNPSPYRPLSITPTPHSRCLLQTVPKGWLTLIRRLLCTWLR